MLSGVTRGACPPVHLDKATGNGAQFRRGHTGEKRMHTLDNVTTLTDPVYPLSLDRAHFTSFPNCSQHEPLVTSDVIQLE